MKTVPIIALALTATACQQAPAPTAVASPALITEAEAARMADATVAAWSSMDAARIKALYASNVTGFDYAVGPLAADRAAWDRAQDAFAAGKMDKFVQKERKIQILDADTFVVSGTWDGTSSAIPANNSAVRCTDVYQKEAGGTWSIVNEHCSAVPKPA